MQPVGILGDDGLCWAGVTRSTSLAGAGLGPWGRAALSRQPCSASLSPSRDARAQNDDTLANAKELLQAPLEELLSRPTTTASGGNVEERTTAAGNVTHRHASGHREQRLALSAGSPGTTKPGLNVMSDRQSLTSLGVRGVTGGLFAGTRLVKI